MEGDDFAVRRGDRRVFGVDLDAPWEPWEPDRAGGFFERVAREVQPDVADRYKPGAVEAHSSWRAPGKKRLPPGRQPAQLGRHAAIHKYDPTGRTVGTADPYEFPWFDPVAAAGDDWISTEPERSARAAFGSGMWSRQANKIDRLEPGDLVFVQRNDPAGLAPLDPALPAPKQRALVGVWWVDSKITYPHPDHPRQRAVSVLWTERLVLFDEPVEIPKVAARSPLLKGVGALNARTGFELLPPTDALVVAHDCSLPYRIFDDAVALPDLARDLSNATTGPRPDVLRSIKEAKARNDLRQQVMWAGVLAALDLLLSAGFAVRYTGRWLRYGGDIIAERHNRNGAVEQLQIEAKGLLGSNPNTATVTWHEWTAATQSASAGDGRWWLVVVTDALDDKRRAVRVLPAAVVAGWPRHRVTNWPP